MCLGIPAVVLDVDHNNTTALVDYGDGVPRLVLIGISEGRVKRGDIVIVHAGVIVSKMSEEEVLEQIRFFREVVGEELESVASIYSLLLEKSRSFRERGV